MTDPMTAATVAARPGRARLGSPDTAAPATSLYRDPVVDTAPAWRSLVLLGAGALAGTVVLAVGNPNTTHVPLCPLRAVTGLDCPFCGCLRAVHSLAHLHLGEAANHNLLFTLAVPFLVTGWALWLWRSVRDPSTATAQPHLPRRLTLALVGLTAAFFVARNVPGLAWLGSTA